MLMVSPLSDRESVNRLANQRVITSANIQNGFRGNEEDKKRILY